MAAGKAKHVLVIVWDGMRPDFVTAEGTPTLYKLAKEGVWFDNHHPVYMSATEVNGTAIATGAYPAHDGVIGNKEFRPDIDPLKPVHTEETDTVRKGDVATHGLYDTDALHLARDPDRSKAWLPSLLRRFGAPSFV